MPFLLQVGASTAAELHEAVGHMACTLGGVDVETRGSAGCVMGDAARGARHELFVHRDHLVLSDEAAGRAWAYAESCLGTPYVLDQVPGPGRGGDGPGLVSGIVSAALGRGPDRLFTSATWRGVAGELGFRKGLGGGGVIGGRVSAAGRPDRPYPGDAVALALEVGAGGPSGSGGQGGSGGQSGSGHVRWVQARLNLAADDRPAGADGPPLEEHGRLDPATVAAVRAFQRRCGLPDDGRLDRATWFRLNSLR